MRIGIRSQLIKTEGTTVSEEAVLRFQEGFAFELLTDQLLLY